MHLGATLRLLRVDAGLSLRDLARRIGVSSAYLSRVENGVDAVPTPERLAAIARELDVPSTLLMDVAHRLSPFVAHYLEEVPGASALLLDLARRRLTAEQLSRVRAFLDAEFPVRAAWPDAPVPALAPVLAPGRMVLRMTCGALEDALDVAAGRLAADLPGVSASRLVAELRRREAESSNAVGNGVAVPHAYVANTPPLAALVTLARPLQVETPDDVPLRMLVVLVGGERGPTWLARLAHVARLASHGLAERLADVEQASQVHERLAELESPR
ncbi:helix-turn-helix domain-containing protein [Melittangium boletus]|uniref:PTS fructose IIA component protein n=1 Tax=Melittangium boletus DSM 14713 TaxID=1294270 RepID=A0A250IDL9_9BACT|nr:helix-turn-helix domain-containing protein [Melittangium boletus]ATB29217.1 PTS fructose IIA component protein [Melittangium boletus DSM 14713]